MNAIKGFRCRPIKLTNHLLEIWFDETGECGEEEVVVGDAADKAAGCQTPAKYKWGKYAPTVISVKLLMTNSQMPLNYSARNWRGTRNGLRGDANRFNLVGWIQRRSVELSSCGKFAVQIRRSEQEEGEEEEEEEGRLRKWFRPEWNSSGRINAHSSQSTSGLICAENCN